MAKRAKPEEIIAKLREAEVRLSQGKSVGVGAKSIDSCKSAYIEASGVSGYCEIARHPVFWA